MKKRKRYVRKIEKKPEREGERWREK